MNLSRKQALLESSRVMALVSAVTSAVTEVNSVLATIGRSPESWFAMQDSHDLWVARQQVNLQRVGKVKLAAA